ncbi:hypothetical protein, partial [Pseudomonas aeruginosa]|uniref:hypothetical protein n=1 Tax=Pseudomonas aeruginosa TaxID=287 RepID=UPI001E5E0054
MGTSAFRKNDAERVREHLYAFGQSVLHTEMQRLLGRASTRINPHFSQPCALGRFDGRRSSQVAQAADSADFGQAPASALEQGA